MLEVNADGLKAKLKAIEEVLKETLENELLNLGATMKRNIADTSAISYSPTWAAAKDWTGQSYFKTHQGLLQKVEESPIGLDHDNNRITMRFGHIPTMDQLTVSEGFEGKGFPYWRIFEYGTPGVRAGKSTKFGFFTPFGNDVESGPFKKGGYGRRGDGYSIPAKNIKTHPGVMPVHLFGDTFAHFKPLIGKTLEKKVKAAIRNI